VVKDTRSSPGLSIEDAVDLACTRLDTNWVSADQRTRVSRILGTFISFCHQGFILMRSRRCRPQ
jgi:hypothetical protein